MKTGRALVFLALTILLSAPYVLAQEEQNMKAVNKLIGEVEAALAKAPAPPEGIDTEQALKAARELGLLNDTGEEIIVIEDEDLTADRAADAAADDDTVPAGKKKKETRTAQSEPVEDKTNPQLMNLGDPSANEDTETQVARNNSPANNEAGSPGLYFWQNIENISAQECMQRAKAAFESEGMTIGNGDYWWYGAFEPRFHSYNNCLDIGNGKTIVNFTSASWRMDTLDQLNRLISAYNSPAGTSKQAPYSGEVDRPIPELYMWVQMRNISQSECIKRATNVLKSEGLNVSGSDTWFVAGQDARFNTYVACTDLGGGNVYVNVTSTSSQTEDLNGHRDRIVQAITK
ncbi:MAG: hypothetical protein CL946_13865 [Ectothiorhodospiraceae bacterium]|nr:hypothetical protein [Ectothiorhodospiraceae bacterium]